jgi:hypothetical protein
MVNGKARTVINGIDVPGAEVDTDPHRALLSAVELMGPGRSPKLAQATITATTMTTSTRATIRVARGFIPAD